MDDHSKKVDGKVESPLLKQRQGKVFLVSPVAKADFGKWPKSRRGNEFYESNKKNKNSRKQGGWQFKGGGTAQDPLNLSALIQRPPGSESPQVESPVANETLNFIPYDTSDPLKLNSLDDNILLQVPKKRRKRKRRNTFQSGEQLPELDPPVKIPPSAADPEICIDLTEAKIPALDSSGSKDNLESSNKNSQRQFRRGARQHKCHARHRGQRMPNQGRTQSASSDRNYKQKDERFRYGNYNRYYGYRNVQNSGDVRIDILQQGWFKDKCVLDIGCNVGHLTLWVAKNFNPSRMKGVDIDVNLIKAAKSNIRHYISAEEENNFPVSLPMTLGPIAAPPLPDSGAKGFPNNVSFIVENYVPSSDQILEYVKEEYDLIMCLSVTKWIQLNWGDDALKRTFKKIFKQLKPGGRFLLEPQPLNSYAKKKNLTADHSANYEKMELLPDQYVTYLLSKEVGFAQSEVLRASKGKAKGFKRPMYLLTKSRLATSSSCADLQANANNILSND